MEGGRREVDIDAVSNWGQDYKEISSMDWCSTDNLCSEMT